MDPRKILDLGPNPTLEEIRQAYRRAAAKYHPDAGGDAWVFQQIQQAYDQLRLEHEQAESLRPSPSGTVDKSGGDSKPRQRKKQQASGQTATDQASTDHSSTDTATTKRQRTTESHKSPVGPTPDEGGSQNGPKASWRDWIFGKPLRLHNETSYFVFANFMDLVMTAILLRFSAVEANPIANYFYQRYGFVGMLALKLSSVALVVAVAQVIAGRNEFKARVLLVSGTLLVVVVVVYSLFLARNQIHG